MDGFKGGPDGAPLFFFLSKEKKRFLTFNVFLKIIYIFFFLFWPLKLFFMQFGP